MAFGINSNDLITEQDRRSFVPKFDAKHPIETDNEGRQLSGTSALILQGFTKKGIPNTKTDKNTGEVVTTTILRTALVFACLGCDGRFKNIPILTKDKILEIAFTKMGLKLPTIGTSNPLSDIPGLEGFSGTYDIDWAKIYEIIFPMRGKTFTGVMTQKQKKSGIYIFELNVATLKPVMVGGEQHALQKPEDTNPEIKDFDWDN